MTDQRFGSYQVVRLLGEGSMGAVFEAVHAEIGRRAAIKVLKPALARDPQLSARFLNEARAANRVQHPGLVNIYELGRTAAGEAYLVMEYLEGETLRLRLSRVGALAPADAARLLRQLAGVLHAAHDKGVIHRDLKPENVFLVPEPELPGGERAKLLDLGVAKSADPLAPGLTQAGALLGTPAYMAPEQFGGAGEVDGKADIYGLGVVLYEALTGALPFAAEGLLALMFQHLSAPPRPVRALAPAVPEALAALVEAMLAKDPAQRPAALAVAQALEAGGLLSAAPSASSPAPAVEVSQQRSRGDNTAENYFYLDGVAADPGAVLLATPCWNPGGQGGAYHRHHVGVWFTGGRGWSIFNQDRAPMPTGAAFNVLRARAGFAHRAEPGNIINNWTLIDHPACNGRPQARLLLTANWNPGGLGQTYNDHAIGAWYTNGRWSVFNQDRAPMPPGAAFNVLVAEDAICHRVRPDNLLSGNGTWIDHPLANGAPDAVVLVTANWNPGGEGGTYNDHATGVYYGNGRWAIFNQDLAPMPLGACFNVLVLRPGR